MEPTNPYHPQPQLPRARTISPNAGQSYQYPQQHHTTTPQHQQQQSTTTTTTEQQQFQYATHVGGQSSNDAYLYPHQQIQQLQQQQVSPQHLQQIQQQQIPQDQIQQQQIQQQHIQQQQVQQQQVQQQQQVHQRQLSQPYPYSQGASPSQQQPTGIHPNDTAVYASQIAQQNQDNQHHSADVPTNSPLHQQPQQNIHVNIPPQLPPGWDAHWDQRQQRYYYHNTALGQTTWELRE
jgi:transcriptional adapter 2-alpha